MGKINIVITESAYDDLEDIETYISQDSPSIARNFISKIFDKIDQLYQYPMSGKLVSTGTASFIKLLMITISMLLE